MVSWLVVECIRVLVKLKTVPDIPLLLLFIRVNIDDGGGVAGRGSRIVNEETGWKIALN